MPTKLPRSGLVQIRLSPAGDKRMVQQIRPPCVENGEEADLRTKMLRVGGDRPQSLGDRAEQNAVDDRLVLQGNGRQLGRQGKHQAVVYGILFRTVAETLRTIAADPKHL